MNLIIKLFLACSLFIASLLNAQEFNLDMYPKPTSGKKQVYIQVPVVQNEANLKVEIYIGKEMKVDCNYHSLIGKLKEKSLEGWGYSYFEIESDGKMTSTLMGCPNQELTTQFIYMQPKVVAYNSKLPLVFYIPNDLEVKYKIYTTSEDFLDAKTKTTTPITPLVGKIDYVQLHNYFSKHTTKKIKTKITSQKEFDSFFGSATVMGTNGKPTPIDFTKQIVIAISKDLTNYNTSIEISGVAMGSMGDVIVSYKINKGTKQTYSIRPLTLLAIDKNNSGKIILKEIK